MICWRVGHRDEATTSDFIYDLWLRLARVIPGLGEAMVWPEGVSGHSKKSRAA
jgi:hypothetical protein